MLRILRAQAVESQAATRASLQLTEEVQKARQLAAYTQQAVDWQSDQLGLRPKVAARPYKRRTRPTALVVEHRSAGC